METKTKSKKIKPPRQSENWKAKLPAVTGRMLLILAVSVVLGLMLSGLHAAGNRILRVAVTALTYLFLLFLFFNEGMSHGVKDTEISRRVEKQIKNGGSVSPEDDKGCYSPKRMLTATVLVFLVPFLLSVIVAVTSKPYTYQLQDLPSWLTSSYGSRSDILGPLAPYTATVSMTVTDWFRLITRVLSMNFIGFFADTTRQIATIDRLIPFYYLTFILVTMAGYFVSPLRQSKIAKAQRKAKKRAVRKQERSSLAQQLTGGGGDVHYGQRQDVKDDKRRLI